MEWYHVFIFIVIVILAILYIKLWAANHIYTAGDEKIKELVFAARAAEVPEDDNSADRPSWIIEMMIGAPKKQEKIDAIRKQIDELEPYARDSPNPLTGNITYMMDDEQLKKVIRTKLSEWRANGILITNEEFMKLEPSKYHFQLSKFLLPINKYADVTRIFGAEYLRDIFERDGVADQVNVPNYKLVVPDLNNITAIITSKNEVGSEEMLVWRGVLGKLYADKIIGSPYTLPILEEIQKLKGVMKSVMKWDRTTKYPRGDHIQSMANSVYNDYGIGIGDNALGDNIIKADKLYFIDTELKSFKCEYPKNDMTEYMQDRFKVMRKLPIGEYIRSYELSVNTI